MDTEIKFENQCIIDTGKIFYTENRVFRAFTKESDAVFYRSLISDFKIENLIKRNLLVNTWISDYKLPNFKLIVEHEKIDYFLHPSEMTDYMFWICAKNFIQLCIEAQKVNLLIKDAHPWNMTFHKGSPIFFDFTSIVQGNNYSLQWFNEFYIYFAVPIKLASTKWNELSLDYRRQHKFGVGITMANKKIVKQTLLRSFLKIQKSIASTSTFLNKIDYWLDQNKPQVKKGYWDQYEQAHESDYKIPKTIKQQFVFDVIKNLKPKTVCDLATNKGFYAHMAEYLGAHVIGFDYEPYSVNKAYEIIDGKNITYALMDFTYPTVGYGVGGVGPNAFSRFNSELSLALGLIHHICITQKIPVKLFCEICINYGTKGTILEFVYPEDIHMKSWNATIPEDYTKENLQKYFYKAYKSFKESEMITHDGIKRQIFIFYNEEN